MDNVHMGMWYGKLNTLKGSAVLVLDGEVCDEWQKNKNFCPFVTTQVWVRETKKYPWQRCNAMMFLETSNKSLKSF